MKPINQAEHHDLARSAYELLNDIGLQRLEQVCWSVWPTSDHPIGKLCSSRGAPSDKGEPHQLQYPNENHEIQNVESGNYKLTNLSFSNPKPDPNETEKHKRQIIFVMNLISH